MKKLICVTLLVFLCFSCYKDGESLTTNEDRNPDGTIVDESLLMVNLQFPHNNELCNLGTNVTPTQSTVFFEWELNQNVIRYTIFIENLISGTIIQEETTEDKIGIMLDRATPYSWYIVASSDLETEQTETWKFFNAGPGAQSYAPFPTVIVAPNMAQSLSATSSVTLQWTGSDVDNDIVNYDIYFGTSESPSIYASDFVGNETTVSISSGQIYYWKVVTKDSEGNTSGSGVFQFKVL